MAGLFGTAFALVVVQGSGSLPGLLALALLLGDHVLDVLLLCKSALTLLLEQLVSSRLLARRGISGTAGAADRLSVGVLKGIAEKVLV